MRRLFGGGCSIAMLPNQSCGLIEAMSLVPLCVIDQSFVVQFADHEIIRSSTRQSSSVFHLENSASVVWLAKGANSYGRLCGKSIGRPLLSRAQAISRATSDRSRFIHGPGE